MYFRNKRRTLTLPESTEIEKKAAVISAKITFILIREQLLNFTCYNKLHKIIGISSTVSKVYHVDFQKP